MASIGMDIAAIVEKNDDRAKEYEIDASILATVSTPMIYAFPMFAVLNSEHPSHPCM